MMIAIDTDEKLNWLLAAFESDDFQVVPKKWTEEEREEVRREIAEYKAMHSKTPAEEAILA